MTIRDRLRVSLGERAYDIHIGEGLLAEPPLWRELVPGTTALVVSDTTVGPLYGKRLSETLTSLDVRVSHHLLKEGEHTKNIESWRAITDQLAEERHDRATTLIALGGGVVGDLTGFTAATWLRGVGYVQAPTSLLAQVDSSVGGKTGINHQRGKNLIGAFYQPSGVVADLETLASLPQRELVAGLAEIIKYGVIRDAEFFHWIERHLDGLLSGQADLLAYAVARSCQIKAEVVAADERESGLREILNFGHTFAHALETLSDYSQINHGEAVAIGMIMAARLSHAEGWLQEDDLKRIERLITRLPVLDCLPKGLSLEGMLEAFQSDKKARAGRLRFVLTRGLGHAETSETVGREGLVRVLDGFLS